MLESEDTPLKPATLDVRDARHASVVLTEGRYHQVRRMFAAVGNHVEALHRSAVGGLTLGDLAPGEWRLVERRRTREPHSFSSASQPSRPSFRKVSTLRSTITSGSGNASTARDTLSSRSRCSVG